MRSRVPFTAQARNGRDSNPRGVNPSAFKADAFGRSATVPSANLPTFTASGAYGVHTCSNRVITPSTTVINQPNGTNRKSPGAPALGWAICNCTNSSGVTP